MLNQMDQIDWIASPSYLVIFHFLLSLCILCAIILSATFCDVVWRIIVIFLLVFHSANMIRPQMFLSRCLSAL